MTKDYDVKISELRQKIGDLSEKKNNLERKRDKLRAKDAGLPTKPGHYLSEVDGIVLELWTDGTWGDGWSMPLEVRDVMEYAPFIRLVPKKTKEKA